MYLPVCRKNDLWLLSFFADCLMGIGTFPLLTEDWVHVIIPFESFHPSLQRVFLPLHKDHCSAKYLKGASTNLRGSLSFAIFDFLNYLALLEKQSSTTQGTNWTWPSFPTVGSVQQLFQGTEFGDFLRLTLRNHFEKLLNHISLNSITTTFSHSSCEW